MSAAENQKTNQDVIQEENFEVIPVEGTLYGMKLRDDILLPNGCLNLTTVKNFKLASDDVIVCSYPKSGTTWTQEIVWLLMNNFDYETAKSKSLAERYIWFDPGLTPRQMDESKPPRLIKNHLPLKFLPQNLIDSKAKLIYVIRNAKDTVVSNYHFYKKVKRDRYVGTFNQLVENFLQGKFWYGPWWEHVQSFYQFPNALIIHYEEMLEKPKEQIEKIALYLGKTISDSQIEKVIEFTSFANFKEKEEKILLKNSEAFFDSDMKFFRKGEIGDWQNHFTPELAKRFDKEIDEKKLTININ